MVLSKINRFLSRLVRVLYLVGIALGLFAFFGGSVKGVADNETVVLTVAACLASAVILHEYLVQERLVSLVYMYFRKNIAPELRSAIARELAVYGVSLVILILFDIYCGVEFRAQNVGMFNLELMTQFIIQSSAIGFLYLASSLLAPQDADAPGHLNRSSLEMLMSTTKATVAQWKNRITRAKKNNLNLAHATAVLMEDAGEGDSARRVRLMDGELAKLEGGVNTRDGSPTDKYKRDKKSDLYLPVTVNTSGSKSGGVSNGNGLANEPQDSRSNEPILKVLRKSRVPVKKTERQRVFDQLDKNPNLTLEQVMALAKVAKNTASKYRKEWLIENPDSDAEEVQNG